MALSDLVLKSQVNMALTRDPRFGRLPIDIRVEEGVVTLTGDLEDPNALVGLEQVVRSVPGVTAVRSAIRSAGNAPADAEQIVQQLLYKLEAQFSELPDQNALTQADYVRWALWMVYKFHIPETVPTADSDQIELDAIERALTQISSAVQIPKALLAMEMLRQADAINDSPLNLVPDSQTPTLSSSPMASQDELPDANSHINRVGVA